MSSGTSGGLDRWATTIEIRQQPQIWRSFAPALASLAAEIRAWLAERRHDEIWFCGAGTSAFIGETLAAYLNRAAGPARFRALPTTDFVAAPRAFLRPGVRVLAVSFGRSGNSSETLGMLAALDAHAPEIDRLNITCNGTSALARERTAGPGEERRIILPAETNDSGFAMTSSYTTMLLSALACFDPAPPAPPEVLFGRLADAAETLIDEGLRTFDAIPTPERAVFLGSGPLTGAAREAALKVLELTAGRVTTSWDSTLGFRHGPKAVVNERTLVFAMQSGDAHTQKYDRDLADEIGRQFGEDTIIRQGAGEDARIRVPIVGNDAWSAVLHVIVAQILAVVWADSLGNTVDDPFAGRNLTRVVSGVTLYDLPRPASHYYGGIDIGGTKIEASLFDAGMQLISKRRVPTRTSSYEGFLDTVADQVAWLDNEAGGCPAIGVGIPGLIDPRDGRALTANIPASGHRLGADISERIGRAVPVANDCKCFALSEANGGAGSGHRTVFGLILGTGVGGGVCVDGRLQHGLNGLPGEMGHSALPAAPVVRHNLPIVRCGCGRTGCCETLVSGPGMSRIAEAITGTAIQPADIAAAAARGEPEAARVYAIWLELLAELVHTIQLSVDPDCVIIGGGLSQIEGLAGQLAETFESHRLSSVRAPHFAIARFGDASGVRGAALLAREAIAQETAA